MLKAKQDEIDILKQEVARHYEMLKAENLTIMQFIKSAKWKRNKQIKSQNLNESEYSSDSQEEVVNIFSCTKCSFLVEHDFQLSTHVIKKKSIINDWDALRYQCKLC